MLRACWAGMVGMGVGSGVAVAIGSAGVGERARSGGTVGWLSVCSGGGRVLIAAAVSGVAAATVKLGAIGGVTLLSLLPPQATSNKLRNKDAIMVFMASFSSFSIVSVRKDERLDIFDLTGLLRPVRSGSTKKKKPAEQSLPGRLRL